MSNGLAISSVDGVTAQGVARVNHILDSMSGCNDTE